VAHVQGGNTGNGSVSLTYTADPVNCVNPVTSAPAVAPVEAEPALTG
jgi:hypothetical protein